MSRPKGKFVVAQLGARMHYAVPRLLHQAGLLECFYTDICANVGWPRVISAIPPPFRGTGLRRLAGRLVQGVPRSYIHAFSWLGANYAYRTSRARTKAERDSVNCWANERFCKTVVAVHRGEPAGIYGFNTASLELLEWARRIGAQGIVEQTMAPIRFEAGILAEERSRFSEWEEQEGMTHWGAHAMCREEEEWNRAGLIVCGSEFVRETLVGAGVPPAKCVTVQYGVRAPVRGSGPVSRKGDRKLRVLTVGAISLRKGHQYVLEVARRLGSSAEFRVIGGCAVSDKAVRALADTVQLVGMVPRSEMWNAYQWADVLFLPSLCEGSATVTYEALAMGIPVLCTPNTGSIVRNAVDGFIVPVRDVEAMEARLADWIRAPDLLTAMSISALEGSRTGSEQAYGERLVRALTPPASTG